MKTKDIHMMDVGDLKKYLEDCPNDYKIYIFDGTDSEIPLHRLDLEINIEEKTLDIVL